MARAQLTFLVHRGRDYTLKHYFKNYGAALRDRVLFRTYPGIGNTGPTFRKRLSRRYKSWWTGTLSARATPPPGSIFAFTDLEILAPWESERVGTLARRLADSPAATVLNDPARSLIRLNLLELLREEGINSFAVFRAAGKVEPGRWPVFIRDDRSHDDGSVSGLLHSPAEYSRHLAAIIDSGSDLHSRTVVEYAGAAGDDGLYRKYGAMRLGDAIVPCHIFFGREWLVKHQDVCNEATIREELEYIETNPHEKVLRRAFDLANIEYGRADYGCVDGRVEIWEVNTNPYLIRPEYTDHKARRKVLEAFSRRFNDALSALLSKWDT
jgi:hypothetical protein